MNYDMNARSRLREDTKTETLVKGMTDAVLAAVNTNNEKAQAPSLVIKHEEDPSLKDSLGKNENLLNLIYKIIPRTITLPKIFNIRGQVEVTKSPAIEVKNLKDLERYFNDLSSQISNLVRAISNVSPQKIDFPKFESNIDISPVTEAIQNLEGALKKTSDKDSLAVLRKIENSITDLANRPQMTPQPVTNVTLNPLNGYMKTTANTVGTTVVSLPQYGQLFNRRALVIYNNSASTIYIGGSDVTTSNGLPVPAGSYSPPIDAGYDLIVYGIAASGGLDVRVIEISKDRTANVQE